MNIETDRSEKSGSDEQGDDDSQPGRRVDRVTQLQTVIRILFHLAGVAFAGDPGCLYVISIQDARRRRKNSLAAWQCQFLVR
jgi:hypothetical protein